MRRAPCRIRSSTRPVKITTTRLFPGTRNRFGDYSKTQVDPSNDFDMWTMQEYAMLRAGIDDGNTGSNSSKWSTWWAKLSLQPTLAKIKSFNATGFDDGRVLLQWNSTYEVDNLGYNVYREVAGQRTKVNPQLVAGSALITGNTVALSSGKGYAWADLPQSTATARYFLEAIDLKGQSTWTGPISVKSFASSPAAALEQSVLLTRIGMAQSQMTIGQGSTPVETRAQVAELSAAGSQIQSGLAGQASIKIPVRREGWYRIPQSELRAAGLDPRVDPRNLQLYVDGRTVPMIVIGEQEGRVDAIEFYGHRPQQRGYGRSRLLAGSHDATRHSHQANKSEWWNCDSRKLPLHSRTQRPHVVLLSLEERRCGELLRAAGDWCGSGSVDDIDGGGGRINRCES